MRRWIAFAASLVIASWLLANQNAPPTRSTGGFGESTCTACHTGAAVNSGPGTFRIVGAPAQYTPGASVPITLTLAQNQQRRWGFELAARFRATGAQAGSFTINSSDLLARVTSGIWYITQTTAGLHDGVADGPVSWTVNWVAPAGGGEVLFTAAGLAADGDGTERGDFTYTAQASSAPPGQLPSPLPAKPSVYVLPHSVRGGGYVTRIFLSNLTPSANQIQLNTVSTDGRVVESAQISLASGGSYTTATNETDRFASEMQIRWIAIGADAPVAVSLLYDLHNPTTRELQTAAAVLDSTMQTLATAPFYYRPDGVTLGLAIANVAEVENTLTLKLLDSQGSVVVNDTLTLAPYAQTAFIVPDRPAFRDYLRGRTEFFGALTLAGTQRFASVAVGAEGTELFSVPLTSGAAH